jgi:hypothetical protein
MASADRKTTCTNLRQRTRLSPVRENSYNTWFKKWGVEFDRKHSASSWAVVGSRVQKRDRLKKKSCVRINGKLISEGKLRKEISRHYFPSHEEQYGQGISPDSSLVLSSSIDISQHQVQDHPWGSRYQSSRPDLYQFHRLFSSVCHG